MRSLFLMMVVAASAFASVASGQVINVPVLDLGKGHQLVGKLHVPLGKVVRVQGFVDRGPDKGFEGGLQLRVQRINDRATQEDIRLLLEDETGAVPPDGSSKVLPEMGKTYELQGYESGGYVGHPRGLEPYLQTVPHYFRLEFHYLRGKLIEPIGFSPSEFEGRRALLQGVARDVAGAAVMDGGRWQVIVRPGATWSKDWLGKPVETLGMYNPLPREDFAKAASQFDLVDGVCRLSNLADQVGQAVELRGVARSLNDTWWFEYRGTRLYVENLEQLPGWTADNYGKPIAIRGQLESAKLPSLDQISIKSSRDLQDHWIVRKAKWVPIDALLAPECVSARD
jgi:hypothetical protein